MAVLERVPLGRISAEAREIHFGRVLLTLLAAVLFGVGWVASKAVLSVAWVCAAVRVGWVEARASKADDG